MGDGQRVAIAEIDRETAGIAGHARIRNVDLTIAAGVERVEVEVEARMHDVVARLS